MQTTCFLTSGGVFKYQQSYQFQTTIQPRYQPTNNPYTEIPDLISYTPIHPSVLIQPYTFTHITKPRTHAYDHADTAPFDASPPA